VAVLQSSERGGAVTHADLQMRRLRTLLPCLHLVDLMLYPAGGSIRSSDRPPVMP
jgi:hypothetical protein